MKKDKIEDLKNLYLRAKKTYYAGNPIMSDEEFDDLEEILKSLNLDVTKIVGSPVTVKGVIPLFDSFTAKTHKGSHLTKLLSLEKIKTDNDSLPPIDDAFRWFNNVNVNEVIFELKYDGNAVNLIYENGKLTSALTRGDGKEGMNITDKVKHMNLPSTIDIGYYKAEIRGEVVISVPLFNSKYNQFKNPRNFIAGVLHRDDLDPSILSDLTFIPFDVRVYNPNMEYKDIDLLNGIFELPYTKKLSLKSSNFKFEFNNIYNELLQYRQVCDFQLDGFVMKTNAVYRGNLGETSHHPKWALAVKFAPKRTTTSINDIEWKVGKTGELFPVALLEPVDLDGATISRCSLYNAGWIIDNKCYPGAVVMIAKKGDIIPGITKVITPSPLSNYSLPDVCPYCSEDLEMDNMHLMCNNDRCDGKLFYQFIYGVDSLKLDFFGEATLEKIFYNTPVKSAFDLFDKNKFNRFNLTSKSIFPDGKNVDRIIEQVNSTTELSVQQTLLMLGIPGLGKRVSEELAKKVSGVKYSTHGLEKRFFDMFDTDGDYYPDLIEGLKILKQNGISIKKYKEEVGIKKVEFTGEPPEQFANKQEFADHIYQYGYKQSSLKRDSDYLITNDYNSSTGKMRKAEEYGIKILTYDDFLKIL